MFVSGDGTVMAADVTTDPAFVAAAPRSLFRLPPHISADFTPDGQRVLAVEPAGGQQAPSITVVMNWMAGIK